VFGFWDSVQIAEDLFVCVHTTRGAFHAMFVPQERTAEKKPQFPDLLPPDCIYCFDMQIGI